MATTNTAVQAGGLGGCRRRPRVSRQVLVGGARSRRRRMKRRRRRRRSAQPAVCRAMGLRGTYSMSLRRTPWRLAGDCVSARGREGALLGGECAKPSGAVRAECASAAAGRAGARRWTGRVCQRCEEAWALRGARGARGACARARNLVQSTCHPHAGPIAAVCTCPAHAHCAGGWPRCPCRWHETHGRGVGRERGKPRSGRGAQLLQQPATGPVKTSPQALPRVWCLPGGLGEPVGWWASGAQGSQPRTAVCQPPPPPVGAAAAALAALQRMPCSMPCPTAVPSSHLTQPGGARGECMGLLRLAACRMLAGHQQWAEAEWQLGAP